MNIHDEFFLWRHDLEAELKTDSQIAGTKKGRVEYAIKGNSEGSPTVFIHGSPGGYDQAYSYLNYMLEENVRMISWSRPGYLRTPLSTGKTIFAQADLLAALLDYLDISPVAINAFSAGGPVALAFAIQHPDRVWAIIMESAVTMRYEPETKIQRFLFHFFLNDPVTWLCHLLAEYAPASIIKSFIDIESDFDDQQIKTVLEHVIGDKRKEAVMMGLIKSISPFSLRKKGLKNDLKQLANLGNLPLHKIKTPVLFLHGKHDAEVSSKHPETACRLMPEAEIYWVPDGMHELSVSDHIDTIRKKKTEFLHRNRPSSPKR